eukprot:2883986-Ditylum_brightwellii.AAC.1
MATECFGILLIDDGVQIILGSFLTFMVCATLVTGHGDVALFHAMSAMPMALAKLMPTIICVTLLMSLSPVMVAFLYLVLCFVLSFPLRVLELA